MNETSQGANTNTILIVIVLLILVALGVWWFAGRGGAVPAPENDGINLDVDATLPAGSGNVPAPNE